MIPPLRRPTRSGRVLLLAWLAAVLFASDSNLRCHLPAALAHPKLPRAADLIIEWSTSGDRVRGWAYDHRFSGVFHPLELLDQDGPRWHWAITLGPDPWQTGGTGTFTITIPADGQATFAGTMQFDDLEQACPSQGRVRVERVRPWPRPVADWQAPAADEHPRLVVRSADLASFRQRADSWWAAPSLNALRQSLASGNEAGGSHGELHRDSARPATLRAHAHLLDADAGHAAAAQQILETSGLLDGGLLAEFHEDIHLAPVVASLALTYDQCFEAWDPAFRQRCAATIALGAVRLYEATIDGKHMTGTNLSPWSNRNAIRICGAAIGAMAVAGDLPADDPQASRLAEIRQIAPYAVRTYLDIGIAASGIGMEGLYYKGMTLDRGLALFLRASQTCLGIHTADPAHDGFLVYGQRIIRDLGERGNIGSCASYWPTLWLTAPTEHRPALVRTFAGGALPPETGDVAAVSPYFTPLHIASFPTAALDSAPVTQPWMAPDPRKACFTFRHPDPAVGIHGLVHWKNDLRPACHYNRFGDWPALVVNAFDQAWLGGLFLPRISECPDAVNNFLGPALTDYRIGEDRSFLVQADLAQHFWQRIPEKSTALRRAAAATGAELIDHPDWGPQFYDHGIGGTRDLLVDCSGASGAPLLIVCSDRLTGVPEPTAAEATDKPKGPAPAFLKKKQKKPARQAASRWLLPLADAEEPRPSTTLTSDRLRIGDADAANLVATSILPGEWHQQELQADDHRYLVVFTIQQGAAPPCTATASEQGWQLQIGDRQVDVDADGRILAWR